MTKTKLEKEWHKFVKDYWNHRCCPYPCINFQDSDNDWLNGAEAFYDFLVAQRRKKND